MPIPPALSVKQPSIAPAPQFGAKKPPSLLKAAVLGVSLVSGWCSGDASTAEKPGIITSGGDTFALTVKDESDVYDDSVNSVNRGANANKYKRLLRNRPSPVADPNMFLPTLFPTARLIPGYVGSIAHTEADSKEGEAIHEEKVSLQTR